MKRDMDLIRLLLCRTESGEDLQELGKYSAAEKAYNIALLHEAQLVQAIVRLDEEGQPNAGVIIRLTWQGHDFLDSIKDDTLWKKAKEVVLKPGLSWTFGILSAWLKAQIAEKLGLGKINL